MREVEIFFCSDLVFYDLWIWRIDMKRLSACIARIILRSGVVYLALATQTQAQSLQFSPVVNLKIGQSSVLHGARSSGCGSAPPDWATVKTWLPATSLGTFADAGMRSRYSDSCKADVKVRAVRFTGRTPGTETFRLFGDSITLTVR